MYIHSPISTTFVSADQHAQQLVRSQLAKLFTDVYLAVTLEQDFLCLYLVIDCLHPGAKGMSCVCMHMGHWGLCCQIAVHH